MVSIGLVIVSVGIISAFLAVAGISAFKKNAAIKNWQNVSFVLGVLLCLMGALLMFEGSILGERTTGIATVIGIVGIGLIVQRRRA